MRNPAMNRLTVETVLAQLAAGHTIPEAAARAELHPQTVRGWIARGNTERTRLQALGLEDVDDIHEDDPRITEIERRYFAFARAAQRAQDLSRAELLDTLYRSATVGLPVERRTSHEVTDPDSGVTTVTDVRTVTTTAIDTDSARWLLERMDPDTYSRPTRVSLEGSLEIAGMTANQAEAFATFTRTLIEALLGALPPRARERAEARVPEALQAAMASIDTHEVPT